MLEEVTELLDVKGLLHDGHPVVGDYPVEEAGALWNYLAVEEDFSHGVHNSVYTKALLQYSLGVLR